MNTISLRPIHVCYLAHLSKVDSIIGSKSSFCILGINQVTLAQGQRWRSTKYLRSVYLDHFLKWYEWFWHMQIYRLQALHLPKLPFLVLRIINIIIFAKVVSSFALEWRTTRSKILHNKKKKEVERERKMTASTSSLNLSRSTHGSISADVGHQAINFCFYCGYELLNYKLVILIMIRKDSFYRFWWFSNSIKC